MCLLLETNILKMINGGFVSNLTQSYLDLRMNGDQHNISVSSAVYHINDDFLEVVFDVQPTEGVNHYTVICRFYEASKYIKDDLSKVKFSVVEKTLNKIIKYCDVKFYSDDPSFLYQGCWEGLYKQDLSIFKFNQPTGKGVWDDRHFKSGGLQNNQIHLTKHIAQIIQSFRAYISRIAQVLEIKN